MIKPGELRLNNSVISKCHQGLITEVRDLSPTSLKLWANPFANYKYEDIDPIPLTPEILQKCGFPETKGLWYEHEISSFFLDGSGNFFAGEVLNVDSPVIAKNIKYLHQLQNLYFMLTGSELTVNL